MRKVLAPSLIAGLLAALAAPAATAQNLLVNGGFESSSSATATPTGWFNIGHTDGVLTYSAIGTQPVYEGLRFYDLGGAGNNGNLAIGEGIGQSFASIVGATYRLTFGLSGENVPGTAVETLRASAGNGVVDYALTPVAGGVFTRPFTTQSFTFMAAAASTTLSFILQASSGATGNNDPLLDGVIVELVTSPVTPVPEPETWALMLAGLSGVSFMRRRQQRRAAR